MQQKSNYELMCGYATRKGVILSKTQKTKYKLSHTRKIFNNLREVERELNTLKTYA